MQQAELDRLIGHHTDQIDHDTRPSEMSPQEALFLLRAVEEHARTAANALREENPEIVEPE